MFNSLSDRLGATFDKLRGKGRLTEDDINLAMRELRMALLEADVNYRVVKNFVSACKQKCMTAEVLDSLTPAQNVVRIVLDQLTELLGTSDRPAAINDIMLYLPAESWIDRLPDIYRKSDNGKCYFIKIQRVRGRKNDRGQNFGQYFW